MSAYDGTRAQPQSDAVAARADRIRRLAVDLPRAAGGDHSGSGLDGEGGVADHHGRPDASSSVHHAGHRRMRRSSRRSRTVIEQAARQHALHLASRRIAVGVHDPADGVAAFAREFQLAVASSVSK